MLYGVDTSGKIGEGSLYIAIVRHEETGIMNILRDKVRRRHKGLSSRRRIKASYLTKDELGWVLKNFKSRHDGVALSIPDFSDIKKHASHIKSWKIKVLAAAIYLAGRRIIKSGDVVLIDRDYSGDVMKSLLYYLRSLFAADKKEVTFESGTSFNEVIAKADLIAGCMRRNVIMPRKTSVKEVIRLAKSI